jgi:hypothetical protein
MTVGVTLDNGTVIVTFPQGTTAGAKGEERVSCDRMAALVRMCLRVKPKDMMHYFLAFERQSE